MLPLEQAELMVLQRAELGWVVVAAEELQIAILQGFNHL